MTAGRLQLHVVLGPCDDMRAEVFFRVALPEAAVRLTGTVTGPQCRLATTLPTTARVVALAAGGAAAVGETESVGRAILTEPSFWTPELPNLYRLELRLADGGDREIAVHRGAIGLRRLGVRRRSLWLDGRRWVPRGVGSTAEEFDAVALRNAAAAAVLVEPSEALLAEADAAGVAIVAVLGDLGDGAADRIAVWAAHPAAVLAVVPRTATAEQAAAFAVTLRRIKGTLLLAWAVSAAEPPPARVPEGIDCLVVELPEDAVPHERWRDPPAVPLLAWRASGLPSEEQRRACDALQAALAAWGLAAGGDRLAWDWAGYVVC